MLLLGEAVNAHTNAGDASRMPCILHYAWDGQLSGGLPW